MEDRDTVASSVFFTGVSLSIEPDRLRQHFESVGHVISFVTYGPAPGKEFRYGIAGYMDPKTAEEGIRRLNGTTFGERAMRVTAARSTNLHPPVRAGPGGGGSGPAGRPPFHKREREGYVPDRGPYGGAGAAAGGPPSSSSSAPFFGRGRGRGRGTWAPPGRAPMIPRPVTAPPTSVDKDGRELMQLPRGFIDPILGTEGSLVLTTLRGMATEEAYAAVEQLRVLALERPDEARQLLQSNPALKSAVVITLQHAGRLSPGRLPSEAYRAPRVVNKETEKKPENEQQQQQPQQEQQPQQPQPMPAAGERGGNTFLSPGMTAAAASPASADSVASTPPAVRAPPPVAAAAPVRAPPPRASEPAPMTAQERDEVLELIQNMSEEDVDRVLTMSARDLAQVPDMAQRKQLEILQRRLLEMSRNL